MWVKQFGEAVDGHEFNTRSDPPGSKPAWASCFNCTHFVRRISGNTIECNNPRLNPITADGRHGCAFWVREIGADDDRS